MLVPADLEVRIAAAGIIGAPFRPRGDAPEGWDCRGCARWCLATFCGVPTPDYRDLYDEAVFTRSARRDRARLLGEGFGRWRQVEPQAGVVALLERFGVAGHVGFMISPRRMIHADVRCDTVVLDLDDPAAGYRLTGAFVPAHIHSIERGDPHG